MTTVAAVTVDTNRGSAAPEALQVHGPATGPITAGRSPAVPRQGITMRSWPLLALAAPAAAEVWSGWVGIAQKTRFGLVPPLPGILPSLHLNTAITLPVGVEAYAGYALRAWLASGHAVRSRTRRFAKWSAMCSFALGMAGQVTYHLLAQAQMTRAPWAITTIVSCLPVLVLAMGTTLAHMLHADTAAIATQDRATPVPAAGSRRACSMEVRPVPDRDEAARAGILMGSASLARTRMASFRRRSTAAEAYGPAPLISLEKMDHARLIAHELAATGKPVSRRILRRGGVKGSNEVLNTLARNLRTEVASPDEGTPGASRP